MKPFTRTDVLKIVTTGPLHMRVHELADAATDVDGSEWPAGTRVAPISTGQRNDLPGSPLYQIVTIAGLERTFLKDLPR